MCSLLTGTGTGSDSRIATWQVTTLRSAEIKFHEELKKKCVGSKKTLVKLLNSLSRTHLVGKKFFVDVDMVHGRRMKYVHLEHTCIR